MRRNPRIGLALGSGSSRGWAHIGAIRALEARGVKPDIICGSSVGALVGGAFASGELERLEKWVTGLAWTTVVRLMDLTWRGGLISGNRIFAVFRNNLFEKSGLKPADMDVIESNEAFAVQAMAVTKDLGLDPAKVNPNGGAVALGHPIGATGAILTVKALYELERTKKRYALVTMCIGGGQGIAAIFERI